MKDEPSKWNCRNRRNFITFKSHINKLYLLQHFRNIMPVRYYTICHESADENHPYEHTHFLITFKKQPNFKDCRCFDYEGIHPNIEFVYTDKHYNNAHRYCYKEDKLVHSNYVDDGTSHTVKVQIEKISKKRTLKEVLFSEDTAGIAKERTYWAKQIFHMSRKRRRKKTQFHVYYGDSHTGKTETTNRDYPDADRILIRNDFVMGYKFNDVVIINEFNPRKLECLDLLRFTEGGPCTIQVKGGETEWFPKLLILTTKKHPGDWYPKLPERTPDIMNRIDKLFLCRKNTPMQLMQDSAGAINVKAPLSPEASTLVGKKTTLDQPT